MIFATINNQRDESEALNVAPVRPATEIGTAYRAWAGAPAGDPFALARSDSAVVAIARLTACPDGWDFQLIVRTADRRAATTGVFPEHDQRRRGDRGRALRLGCLFADGSAAVDRMHPYVRLAPGIHCGAVMMPHAPAAGDDHVAMRTYWVSPLPPPGEVRILCEWVEAGIALTEHAFPASVLHEAAERAVALSLPEAIAGD